MIEKKMNKHARWQPSAGGKVGFTKCSQYKKYRRPSLKNPYGSHECSVMLSARRLGIARFIKSTEIMSGQTTVDSRTVTGPVAVHRLTR